MLTIGFSLSSGIKLLERGLAVKMKSISKAMQDVVYSVTPAAVADAKAVAVATVAPTLKIAKTTMPDQRLDFNQTFQHIRFELDVLYKEQNPIFDNIAVPELWESQKAAVNCRHIDNTLAVAAAQTTEADPDSTSPALWVAKTTLPNQRLDFNQTFQHIRSGLNEFYKERNPAFKVEAAELHNSEATVQMIALRQEPAERFTLLATKDRTRVISPQHAAFRAEAEERICLEA